MFENIVIKWNNGCGIFSSSNPQMPYTTMADHCMKKAITKRDMFCAARCEAASDVDTPFRDLLTALERLRRRLKVIEYSVAFTISIRADGIVVKQILAIRPLIPSKKQLKRKKHIFCGTISYEVRHIDEAGAMNKHKHRELIKTVSISIWYIIIILL